MYVYKRLNSQAPSYQQSAVFVNTSKYATRSTYDKTRLGIPKTRTSTGDCAFSAAAPRLWNPSLVSSGSPKHFV
ncbi:hypothetical protein HOLleu_26543 [Holothuria leucospilota]|uniref:Uncharacterized protein n=1 Tax=Holothuria leucospilota TaxID=206669 RepID=A0A9Q1BP82_HOLLE|nr:hypothetical protein HOLleu_26543 [Holothuria leucospilota]